VINKYIESIIDKHQIEFGVYFSDTYRKVINDAIVKNIYAFNIIYDIQMKVHEIKYVDHNLCVHEDQLNTWSQNKMWSYDGGQRYQWSEMETLVFDPSVIRDIKLESIIK
jgi:hypothetical protein